jgi:hypothetical protein
MSYILRDVSFAEVGSICRVALRGPSGHLRRGHPITWFSNITQWGFRERGGEELWCQSQEDQELSAAAVADQLILKMISEHQTVDHRNKLMGNDPNSIFVRFHTACSTKTNKL